MIGISEKIFLEPIQLTDQEMLLQLMSRIYPAVYHHLWFDMGQWYVQKIYSAENLGSELEDDHARYYFVYFEGKQVGVLRTLLQESMPGFSEEIMVKIHRIYLDPAVHGNGIGKELFKWIESEFCLEWGLPLWLETMDTQQEAIGFYEKMGFEKAGRFRLDFELMKPEFRGMFYMIKRP